ncbi:MAG: sigma-70 family RNA polymerase sigma factor [Eubacteriales bacterium]|nr:sigma-70 family RNA polymerase sigma factor [Eubacteriales bacterium]
MLMLEEVIERYGDMLFRICIVSLANRQDAEDALQETFLRYLTRAPEFNDAEHEKAWLIKVATNICKDLHRSIFRNTHMDIDEVGYFLAAEQKDEGTGILEEVLKLKPKYREILILHYVEGYKIREIAQILNISTQAAKKRLQYARDRLRVAADGDGGSKPPSPSASKEEDEG